MKRKIAALVPRDHMLNPQCERSEKWILDYRIWAAANDQNRTLEKCGEVRIVTRITDDFDI